MPSQGAKIPAREHAPGTSIQDDEPIYNLGVCKRWTRLKKGSANMAVTHGMKKLLKNDRSWTALVQYI